MEDALGIVSGTISHDYGGNAAFLTLHWGEYQATDRYVSVARGGDLPIDLSAAVKASGAEPVGRSWKCGSCGEVNPGNFEQCWKCQAVRA